MKAASLRKRSKDGPIKKGGSCVAIGILWLVLVVPSTQAPHTPSCPDADIDPCSCYTFEEGVYLDCHDTTLKDIKDAVKSVPNVHSLSVFDLEAEQEELGAHFIPQGHCIKHIHITRTNIKNVADDTFMPLRKCLETLSIVSGKLKQIPHKAFSGMLQLIAVDFTSNAIENIPSYSFYGLPIIRLTLRGNMIRQISDTAFSSLEASLSEIDLSENNLTAFPIISLAKLKHLRSLKLEWNEITVLPTEHAVLASLDHLDLSSNNFEFVSEDCLKFCPSLAKLSFHFNFISNIHYRAFYSLTSLQYLDLSQNRIKILNPNLFQNNKNLEYINLNHNHLHHIHGLFCNLPALKELLLSRNNILEVPMDAFHNSSNIRRIHLDMNCISNINSESFRNLLNVAELRLDYNYLDKVPHDSFTNNKNLKILRLDNNNISNFHNSTFWPLINVTEYKFSSNKINYISKFYFMYSVEVEQMHLDNNNISFVEPGTFVNMSKLKYLSLNNNKLLDINDILPKLDSNLVSLRLDHNSLSLINSFLFQSHERIRHLSLKNNRLKFLTRDTLRNLTRLTRLELNYNEFSIIEDFSFQNLNSVRSLDLRHNLLLNISNYTFCGLIELEDLDLSDNRIGVVSAMAFDSLRKLRSLDLSRNPLRTLHRHIFQQGLPLSALNLDTCDIRHIQNGTFQGLNNLKSLSLRNNSLSPDDLFSIDVPGLKSLILSYNVINYLPAEAFSQFPLLEILMLEHCDIEHIFEGTFANNRNLFKLNLAQNILSTFPPKLFGIQSVIADLNISNNFLDYVPYHTMHNLSLIETLDLSDNLLPRIELSGFEKLKQIKYLILKNNEISSITATKKVAFYELVLLDISFNRLETLPPFIFEIFPNLQNLNMSYNDIVRFDYVMMIIKMGITLVNIDVSKNPVDWSSFQGDHNSSLVPSIYELHMSGTNLSAVDDVIFNSYTSLQHLYLRHNKLRRLSISPFSKLALLESLDISDNKISQLKSGNFRGLVKLRALCLSNNNIESLESFAEELRNLKLLDLSHNKIQNILNEDLINLKELTVLHLSHNNIKYISITAFKNLKKIIQIDLEYNKLMAVPMELLNSVENFVQHINLKGNVLRCNCQKNNTWVWIQNHPRIVKGSTCLEDQPKTRCDAPAVSQLTVDKHRDHSVSVSWFIRNRTAIKALQIIYYKEDTYSDIKTKYLEANEVSTHISDLERNTNYVVCVLTLYDEPVAEPESLFNTTFDTGSNVTVKLKDLVASLLTRSPSSECVSFNTFSKPLSVKVRPAKAFDISLILNRRMGLIVGCSLGCVVFFIMVTVLLYTKLKERKRIAKSEPAWSEMNDYHSMQSKEEVQSSNAASTDNILLGTTKKRTLSLDIK